MRRVKKTTSEQFDLLKAEMAVHPAAARGYGVGAQRSVVDAEWKEIVNKLNALGPPERTLPEWKKVWSDLRLRSIKRLSDELNPKPKKVKYKSKKNKLLKSLKNEVSIYSSYSENSQQNSYSSPTNIHDESYDNNPLDDENEADLHNTEQHFFKPSHDTSSYDVKSLAEEEDIYHNDSNNYTTDTPPPHNAVQTQFSEDKINYLNETLSTIERQIKNQNIVMEHLTKITSNLAELMDRHVTSVEKQNNIMERQLRAMEHHNAFLRRQEPKTIIIDKIKKEDVQKS